MGTYGGTFTSRTTVGKESLRKDNGSFANRDLEAEISLLSAEK